MTQSERQLSDRLIYRARPTIRVDGQEHALTSELLLDMTMTEHEGGMSELELRFSNLASHPGGDASLAFEDERVLRHGVTLVVYAGDEVQPQEIFQGKITALEAEFSQDAPPELVVFAEDALHRARLARRTALHRDASIAELSRALAERVGLRPVITGYGESIGTQVQLNESDLAFLRRILRTYDGDLQVVGEELHVSPRAEVRRDTVNLRLFSQLMRARVTADLAQQTTEVTIAGWDAERAERVGHVSQGHALGPGSGRRGADVLMEALGERSEHVGHLGVVNETEARAFADALYDQRARRFVVLEGTSDGNPALRVGSHVSVTGLSERFDNVFYVTRARHRFDLMQGYLTEFEAECAYLGGA